MANGAQCWLGGRWRLYIQHLDTEIEVFRCILVYIWCDRAGRVRALWCALTRKHGGTARGSQSWAGRQLPGSELLVRGCFACHSTYKHRSPPENPPLLYFSLH